MVFKAFDFKISDLPKIVEIEMSAHASQSAVEEMIESVRSQVVYPTFR